MTQATSKRTPKGRSLIAGVAAEPGASPVQPSESKFYAVDPSSGRDLPTMFLAASAEEIDRACWAAWEAFHAMLERSPADRADLLEHVAARIMELGDDLLAVAGDETGLGPSRLVSERERTVGTLRMFAALVRKGEWVEASIDSAQPSRRPTPKPDLRRMLRPLGPVAVFGAGNFPLAYSTAGGDTASALAAGCPVVVKGHPGHPGTGELVASAIAEALHDCRFEPETFSYLQSGGPREMAIGQQLVRHPAIRAVGFTGSVAGGTALAAIAAERADPIPVFAEMGSTNPVFVLPAVLEAQGAEIAERLVGSITAANGQMCTCPGLIFVPRGSPAEALTQAMAKAMNALTPQAMLSRRTLATYQRRLDEVRQAAGVEQVVGMVDPAGAAKASGPIRCSAALLKTTLDVFRRSPALQDEVFGPAALIVVCERPEQLADAAACIRGSLTGTIWSGPTDQKLARLVLAVLEQRVGRIVFNGVPTGVEVCHSIVHGGPFPATNQPHTTAVGPHAIRRWVRPVCYQNAPDAFLPAELRNGNLLRLRRVVNGEAVEPG
ncbi:MAG: aldehyde dehydrogenase (NADP(+)) [Phycisphaerae bacterium]|nr:aldehyde dehydrogenase (NADP(+)) [Phycisphaerae bacterium]